jgi:hypothetical protein
LTTVCELDQRSLFCPVFQAEIVGGMRHLTPAKWPF